MQLQQLFCLRSFKKGENEVFSKIYRHFRKPILHYVRSRTSDTELAEELTQEIFLKVFRFRESYDTTYAFSTWLWTIARNTVHDVLRKPDAMPAVGVKSEEVPSTRHNAEVLMIKKDRLKMVRKLLKPLTQLQRRVLWLRIVHQLSYDEIARKLDLSLAAVKNLIYRAKQTLGPEILAYA